MKIPITYNICIEDKKKYDDILKWGKKEIIEYIDFPDDSDIVYGRWDGRITDNISCCLVISAHINKYRMFAHLSVIYHDDNWMRTQLIHSWAFDTLNIVNHRFKFNHNHFSINVVDTDVKQNKKDIKIY